MPRQKRVPAYLLHQATGQARVRINGKDHYLGAFASPESKALYREKLEEWGCGEKLIVSVSIGVLCLRSLEYAKEYYQKNGRQTSEVSAIQVALLQRFNSVAAQDKCLCSVVAGELIYGAAKSQRKQETLKQLDRTPRRNPTPRHRLRTQTRRTGRSEKVAAAPGVLRRTLMPSATHPCYPRHPRSKTNRNSNRGYRG